MTNSPFKGNGLGLRWLLKHVFYQEDECLTWPLRLLNGYGVVSVNGRQCYAHRYMCELAHGPAPTKSHHAAHSCGRGHLGCVNPRHLSWKTPGENQRDRAVHGTRNVWSWRGKITQTQADEIRALKGKVPQRELAKRFGISRSNVSFIHCGKAWNKPPLWDKTKAHTPKQAAIVKTLAELGRATMAIEISKIVGGTPGNTSAILKKLADRGIIERPFHGWYRAIGGRQ